MYNQFTEIMSALHQEIFRLNQHLEKDKKTLPQRQIEAIEQGNIDKLNARNAIDAHIHALQNHPEWSLFQDLLAKRASGQNLEAYDRAINLWQDIDSEIKKTRHLIDIHQQVIQASLSYYTQLFAELVKTGSEEGSLVYEKSK